MGKKTGEKYISIINAAVKVIARHGYHQAQVSKIAKEAQVADGTIYLYFKNKEDLLVSLFSEKMGQFVATAKQQIQTFDTAQDQLRILIHMHFYQLQQDPDLAVVTQLELRQSDPELRRLINEVLKQYLTLIDDVLEKGISQGVFSTDVDPLLMRYMVFGTIDESVTNWLMKERKYDLLSLVNPVHNLLLHGLTRND